VSSIKQQELLAYPSRTPDSPLVFGGVRFANLFCFLFFFGLLCYVCLRPLSHVTNVGSVFWIVHFWLPLWFSLKFISFISTQKSLKIPKGKSMWFSFCYVKICPQYTYSLMLIPRFVSKTIFLSDVSITWLFNPPTMSAQYACYFWKTTCVRTTFYICVFLKIATSIFCKQ